MPHTHSYTRSKPDSTVETCPCGSFRHTEHSGPSIAAIEFTYHYHDRDNFFTRTSPVECVGVHVTGRRDDSPEHTTYPFGYDSRCSCCYLNIPHSERKHDSCMAQYNLTHPVS